MEDTYDSMDNSVIEVSSPTLINVIDLTKDSPSLVRRSRSRQRNAEDVSSSDTISSSSYRGRPISPIVLGNTQDSQMKNIRKKGRVSHATSCNDVLIVDDTKEETCYTVQSDKEPVPLTCPICFEALSSKLKPFTTRCGHLFCLECLQTFLHTSKKCPTCKATITLKSCTRLYL